MYILVILMAFAAKDGVHSQQIPMNSYQACVQQAAKLNEYSGYARITAWCIPTAGDPGAQ